MNFLFSSEPTRSFSVWVACPDSVQPVPWHIVARNALKHYCGVVNTPNSGHPPGLCVTLTHTEFVHKDGVCHGFRIGLANYPKFPKHETQLIHHAEKIAELLIEKLEQDTALVEGPNYTTWVRRMDSIPEAHPKIKETTSC